MASNQPLAPLFDADRLAVIGASDRNHDAGEPKHALQRLKGSNFFRRTRCRHSRYRRPRRHGRATIMAGLRS